MDEKSIPLDLSPSRNTGAEIPGDNAPNNKKDDAYSSKAESYASFSNFVRVFTYSTLLDRIFLTIATLAEIGTGITLPLLNVVFGQLIGNFNNYFIPGSGVTKSQFIHALNRQTLYIVYLFIARWSLSYLSMLIFRMMGLRISAKLRLAYLVALFNQPISVLDTLPSGQASNTLTTVANTLQVGISEKMGSIFQWIAMLVAAIIIAFKYSWSLTLVTSSVILFVFIVYGAVVPLILKATKQVEHADAKASSIAGEVFASIRIIAACGAEERVARKYSGWVEESRRRGLKMSLLSGIQYAPLFFAIYATFGLTFWFGVKQYLGHHISSISTIVIVLMSVMMVTMAAGQLAAPIVAAGKAANAATDFFAIIDAPSPSTDGLAEPHVSAQQDIKLESITFAYPSRPHTKVLDDLSLTFESGKMTAIVGSSGSGKSTIVGLLERWYELDPKRLIKLPQSASTKKKDVKEEIDDVKPLDNEMEDTKTPVLLSGIIRIGNHNIDEINLKWWRSQIGLVQQEPFIFNDTIHKNVEYGLIGSQWENADPETKKHLVEEACKEAFADEYITRLPRGYETQVGDAGIKLSGGQRQRLAIARSIIKKPKILILDEATSAIDVRGERLVQAALDKVSKDRTTITIAHRLSTIKKADKIVVMKNGRLLEQGTHEGLLSDKNGAYSALVNAQQLSMGDATAEVSDFVEEGLTDTTRVMSAQEEVINTEDKTEPYKMRGIFGSLGLFLYEQRKHWPAYSFLAIGCLGAGSGASLQAYLFSKLITSFTLTGNALKHSSDHWSLMFFILAIGIGISFFILGWASNTVAAHISCTYRQEYFESIIKKPIPFFDEEDNSTGTLTGRVANDPTQLQQLLGINMAMVYIAIFNMLGCIIIAFCFGWKLSLLSVFVALPIVLSAGYFRVRYELQFEKMNQDVFAESSKFASEAITAFRTVTALTLEDATCSRYELLLKEHLRKAFHKGKYTTLLFAMSDSVNLLCSALTFYYGGKLLSTHEYGPIAFYVVYMAILQGSEAAGQWLSFGPNIAQASAAANRILSFRLRRPDGSKKSVPEIHDGEGGVKLELRDIWFKYPTRDIPIFTGLNLTVEKGQFAALVGASGCGKTSVISLLERFYEIQKGRILCNGVNIYDLDTADYRKSISLVAQEPTLFQGTIRENILLGVDENTPDDILHQAARDAEIHDFIMSLPEGYSTDVGNRGIALSGGQKQRIAIARALIRKPKILLLDEATSSLDSESERLVQAAFERAGKGRTMVVVAHRLATIQNADVIFVFGEGKVLEKGDHASLLRKRGVYYQMCQSQALDR
ncbi:P-loop containing nucleoside triphosphate hydrolase protein [Xylogone sp. PMI_703]|nr:P-loop containing nucleoside triphosphate hydrolase protein [Xylogone sp. PMI_703]